MRVLAVVPAFNEQESIPALISEIVATGHDVVVGDDASTDGTERAARKVGVPAISLSNISVLAERYRPAFCSHSVVVLTSSCRSMAMVSTIRSRFRPLSVRSSRARPTASSALDIIPRGPIRITAHQFFDGSEYGSQQQFCGR